MLEIYQTTSGFEEFCEYKYKSYFKQKSTYQEIANNLDVLLLNEDKYLTVHIKEYLNFYEYKPTDQYKMSIVNNFDFVDLKIQNKLLKIFEESLHLHVIIVNNLNKVLPTIISRANILEYKPQNIFRDDYPVRYEKLLKILNFDKNVDTNIVDQYIKLNDLLKDGQYLDVYLKITISFMDYDEKILYEIIQYNGQKTLFKSILELQERLFSNSNKKLQIENFLLNAHLNTIK